MNQDQPILVFLCGDVMTGRGIDQILPHPSSPELFESYACDARQYVDLAELTNAAPSGGRSLSIISGAMRCQNYADPRWTCG